MVFAACSRRPRFRGTARFVLTISGIFAVIAIFSDAAFAVPMWARKTGMPCSSCHVGGSSRLTAFGHDFQIRGHRTKFEEKFLNWKTLEDYVTVSAKLRYSGDATSKTNAQSPLNMQDSSLYTGGALSRAWSYYAEYNLYTRNGAPSDTRFADAYLQYTGGAGADHFWYMRTGRLYPFTIYAADAGGRPSISRPRLVSDNLAGFIPALEDRMFGVSSGISDSRGGRVEVAVTNGSSDGEPSGMASQPGGYLTLEKDFDLYGSGVGAYFESGHVSDGGESFTQTGLLGRFVQDRFSLTGGFGVAAARDMKTGEMQRPTAFYLEGTRDFLVETTGFLRYDNLQNHTGSAPRTQGYALGITQRIPKRGKIALEYSHDFAGVKQNHSVFLDTLLMY